MSSSKLVSVAIDFGTTYSGYAFSFHHAKNDIKTFLWKSSSFESEKTPTCILFDSERRFHSFGFKAEDEYAELSRRGVASSWFFFKQFKLALHDAKVRVPAHDFYFVELELGKTYKYKYMLKGRTGLYRNVDFHSGILPLDT